MLNEIWLKIIDPNQSGNVPILQFKQLLLHLAQGYLLGDFEVIQSDYIKKVLKRLRKEEVIVDNDLILSRKSKKVANLKLGMKFTLL